MELSVPVTTARTRPQSLVTSSIKWGDDRDTEVTAEGPQDPVPPGALTALQASVALVTEPVLAVSM